MAMLVLNPIFVRTWSGRSGPRPATEYRIDVISATKNKYPGFLFIAEAYWDLEWELQQQGFDSAMTMPVRRAYSMPSGKCTRPALEFRLP
jgi:hypothetical protein